MNLGGSQISVGQSTINNIDPEEIDLKKKVSYVFLGTMTAESKIEEERLKLSDNVEFYPEIAFNFLKTFTASIKAQEKFQSFFDFSTPNDVREYSQLDSYKSGYISYAELLSFSEFYNIRMTDKVLECIIKHHDPIGYTNGLSFDTFLKMVVAQSIPLSRQKVIRRKVIYEAQTKQKSIPPESVITSLALIFDLESNLITFTERSKVILQNNIQRVPMILLFESLDTEKRGFLDFRAVQQFIKRMGKQMIPNQYLGLLRRLKKPEVCETISFQDFKDFLTPNLPFFSASGPDQLEVLQHYHEVNKSLDISKSNINQQSRSMMNTTKQNKSYIQNQTKTISSRNPYEDAQDKIYFKDKQGRIIEKNHPYEPIFLPENPHFTEVLKSNINIIQHPQEDSVYALIPEQYMEAPKWNNVAKTTQFQVPPPSGSAPQWAIGTEYEMPHVDTKDMTGVDQFWLGSFGKTPNQMNGQTSSALPGAKLGYSDENPIDFSTIHDPNAISIIQKQQDLIKKQQAQIKKQQTQPTVTAPIVPPPPSGTLPLPLSQQYELQYKQSPFLQDLVQLRHTNTASFEPILPQDKEFMKNTNILQSQYNAKINPYNHNQVLPSKLLASQKIVGAAPNMNNSVMIESLPIPINQIQKSTMLNPQLFKMKAQTQSQTKKKIFDPQPNLFPAAQLNDNTHFFQKSLNQFY